MSKGKMEQQWVQFKFGSALDAVLTQFSFSVVWFNFSRFNSDWL